MNVDEALGILGFAEGEGPSDIADVRARYQRLVKVWHPDRFVGDSETAGYASTQLAAINVAYGVVLNALESGAGIRRSTDRTRAEPSTPPASSEGERARAHGADVRTGRAQPPSPVPPKRDDASPAASTGGADRTAAPAESAASGSRIVHLVVRAVVFVAMSTWLRSTCRPSQEHEQVRATLEAPSVPTASTSRCPQGASWLGSRCQCDGDTPVWSALEQRCIAESNPLPVEMVRIAAGRVTVADGIGAKRVESFLIDVTEVTVDAFSACYRAGNCTKPGEDELCNWGNSRKGNHPINCVDLKQARSYCKWLKKRLPSEEEWQLAAAGPEGRYYPWSDQGLPSDQLCWHRLGSRQGTCAVRQFPRSDTSEGVADLSGNVWEWTESCFDSRCLARVIRGGGWADDSILNVSTRVRVWAEPDVRFYARGFRCVRSL
jgi:formylglycine-generating enzyme required for sulfatase activity